MEIALTPDLEALIDDQVERLHREYPHWVPSFS